MARRLGAEINELKIKDNLSNSEITLYYKMPTTKERVAYSGACIQRKGNKIINKSTEARIRFGKKILTGIEPGSFETLDKNGGWVALSSDVKSDFYREDWKARVEEFGADLIELLAIQVFDLPVQIADGDDEDPDDEDDQDTGEDETQD